MYDVNICLWTNGSSLTQSEAQTACHQRSSFLPRITNSNLQHKLQQFRSHTTLLGGGGFWIDVKTVTTNTFHWIDGSSLAGDGHVEDQDGISTHYAVIRYKNYQFVFSARRWRTVTSSYICQLQQQGATCAGDDLSMNSKCYRKFHNEKTWFSASNNCLSRGGSLAVFTDTGRPSDNSQLTDWLNASGTDKEYWIGLVSYWWKTRDEGGQSVIVQYSNWKNGHPSNEGADNCVVVLRNNYWETYSCIVSQKLVCQNYTATRPITSTTTTTPLRSSDISSTKQTSVTSPTSETTSTSSGIKTSSSQPAVSLDVIIGVTIGVGLPCITICIIVIAVLVYKCHKNKHRESNEKSTPTDDYAMLDNQTQGQQPLYNVLQHQNHNYENAPAAAAAATQR